MLINCLHLYMALIFIGIENENCNKFIFLTVMAFLGTTFMNIEKSELNYTYSINHITTNQIECP
jgi:hypothetical protein